MAMLMPIAAYLAISRGQKRWWFALVLLLGGDFAGGSRTGVIGLVMIVVVFIWLRPRETLRCWPALIPALVVVHFVSPGALGGLQAAFFPKGGLINQQTQTYVGRGGVTEDATRLSRLGPSMHEFWQHNPLFGEGYGTRVTGNLINGKPNPDDNAQVLDDEWLTTFLETGLLGFFGWIWLFGRVIRRLGARAKLEHGLPEGWLPVALAGSVVAFASSMLTYDAFSFTQATFLVFVLMALAAVILMLPPTPRTLGESAPASPSLR
jgi:O-antigen ligase